MKDKLTIENIQFPFNFISIKGFAGFNKNTNPIYSIKSIPNYGNIKVYYMEGMLERFFYMYKSVFEDSLESGDFVIQE